MISIIGLGNPGSRYRMTRHNAGFMALDRYAHENGLSFRPGKGKFFFALLKNTPVKYCLQNPRHI